MAVFPSSHYVLLSVLFFIGLELVVVFHHWILLSSLILLGALIYGIILVRIEEGGDFHPTQAILPILTAAGLTGLAVFLPLTPTIHVYFAVSATLFYWLLRNGARYAYPTWNWVLSTIVLFLNVAVALGFRFNVYLPVIITLLAVFFVSWLVSYQALRRVTSSMLHTCLLALALSLVLTELTWVLQFLPVHFLIQAGVIVVVYYVVFHLLSLSLQHQLTRRHLFEYIGLGALAMTILLATARWI